MICRCRVLHYAGIAEESPDRAELFAAESADGSNLMETVTENNRGNARVKM